MSFSDGSGKVAEKDKINTCRLRSTPAIGMPVICAKLSAGWRLISETVATGSPRGYTPPIPEVASKSVSEQSDLCR